MKEPRPEDYGLTEDSHSIYQRQKNLYEEKVRALELNVQKANQGISVGVKIGCLIDTVVIFSLTMAILFGSISLTAFFIGLFITCVGAGFVAGYINNKKKAEMDERLKAAIQYLREKTIDYELEKKLKDYQKACMLYKLCLEMCAIDYWDDMNGIEFENAVAELYRQYGYSAYVTQATGDGGVDVILRRDGECVAVQCKHHANPVGPKDIRELQGVVMTSDEFDYGIFVSWNGFTPGALEEARVKAQRVRIDLVASGDILIMAGKAHEGFEVRKRPNEPDGPGSESGSGENFRDKFGSINKPSPKKVCLGSIVKAYDYGEEEEVTYKILVGDSPYEESEGWIAISSETPVAQALLGHKENDIVEVTPNGEKYALEILEIS